MYVIQYDSYYRFSGENLTNISGNGGLRGDRICEQTKEKFDSPIECPATVSSTSGGFKNTPHMRSVGLDFQT